MSDIYFHPKDPDTTTIECFISYLRDKRKLDKQTDVEYMLEGLLNLYLNERKKETREPLKIIETLFENLKIFTIDPAIWNVEIEFLTDPIMDFPVIKEKWIN